MKLLPPSARIKEGSISVNGQDITCYREKDMQKLRGRIFSMIFQDPMTSLNPTIKIGKQIAEAVLIHNKNYTKEQVNQKVLELMELVGISHPKERYHQYPWQFSGGMRQRAAFLRTLLCHADILLLDEPFGALDVITRGEMQDWLLSVRKQMNRTVLLVTHDMDEAIYLSDRILVKVTVQPGESFLDKMIALVEGSSRQKTPNEIALTILLAGFTIVFVIVCATLKPFADYVGANITVAAFISLFVCLIPTTIGGLLSAIGIAGMDRALRANVITKSGKAVETAGDIDTLLLDKTGTITIGNRKATKFYPVNGVDAKEFLQLCVLSSAADETPEGKSIVELGREQGFRFSQTDLVGVHMVKFTAETKCSGVDMPDGRRIRKGASEAIRAIAEKAGNVFSPEVDKIVRKISENGGTPLVVSENERIKGVIELQDIIKTGIRERFERLRKMGVKTVMVTGDNPLTAKYIAEQAGVDDFIAEAKPEDKMEYIRREQQAGKLVAMMGDGTNDAPALAQADVGVAMNSGTQAAKEAGNMVDLDNDPTKLIEIVEIGKQLLMTRGTLTTFSIANDVAKYFAIVPALFMTSIPALGALNIMHLASPESAILSAVIFNAIIIPLLIPLALRGVAYKPIGASALLRRNLFIYGLGGIIAPFIGIKLIDMLINLF